MDHGRVIRHHELVRAEWAFVRLLPPVSLRGRKPLDDRRVLNGLVGKFRTGTACRDVSSRLSTPAYAAVPGPASRGSPSGRVIPSSHTARRPGSVSSSSQKYWHSSHRGPPPGSKTSPFGQSVPSPRPAHASQVSPMRPIVCRIIGMRAEGVQGAQTLTFSNTPQHRSAVPRASAGRCLPRPTARRPSARTGRLSDRLRADCRRAFHQDPALTARHQVAPPWPPRPHADE